MKRMDDHEQVPYYRCNICNHQGIANVDGKVTIIPSNAIVRDGAKPSKALLFHKCGNCGAELNKRAHHLALPCIGDVVRFPRNPSLPEGDTLTGKVLEVNVDDTNGAIYLKVVTEGYIDIRGTRIEHCPKWDETNDEINHD